MQRFAKLVKACAESAVSDLYLTGAHPVIFRKNGQCYPQKSVVFTPREVDDLAETLLEARHKRTLRNRWSVDFGMAVAGVNLRCNCVNTARGLSFTFRFLPGQPPSLEHLNLHPTIESICQKKSGLILFCGPTGSGKTSTIAAMINEINRNREAHIITLEDPIEYRFKSIRSFVEQRELGVHFHDFEQGLYDALRQMPDVIMIGELREREIIRQTLNIAESGHLVFGTLHASTPEEAIYRICNAFPTEAQELVRFQLASTIQAVIIQHLEMMPSQGFRVPCLAILRNSNSVKNTLRENKLSQLDSIVELGQQEEMFTFARYRSEFLEKKDKFTPPVVSFVSGKETAQEPGWRSRLIDFDAISPQSDTMPMLLPVQPIHTLQASSAPPAAPRRGQPAGAGAPGAMGAAPPAGAAPRASRAALANDDDQCAGVYRIEEDTPYEELISQMKRQG